MARQASDVLERFPDVRDRLPEVRDTLGAGAQSTAAALRVQPEENLRLAAVASVGFAAGCYVAGGPRLLTIIALAPAVLVATACLSRPIA